MTKVLMTGAIKKFYKALQIFIKQLAKKMFIVGVVIFGLGMVGYLPRSPFAVLNDALVHEHVYAIEFLMYLPVFIPIHEMLAFVTLWTIAVAGWYFIKVYLRFSKVG